MQIIKPKPNKIHANCFQIMHTHSSCPLLCFPTSSTWLASGCWYVLRFFNENLDAKQEFANDFLHVFCLIKGWLHLSFGHTSNTERESRPTSYIQGSWNHAITNPGIEVPPYQKTLKQTKLTYYCSTESPLMGWAFERDNFPINNAAIFHQTQHYNFCSKRIVTTLWIHLQISSVQNGSLVYT